MASITTDIDYPPFFLEAVGGDTNIYYSAADWRRLNKASFARSGVIGHHSFLVTQAPVVGWSIVVNEGFADVDGYVVHMPTDALISLVGFNTSPTGLRTHKVWLAIFDKAVSGTGYKASIIVTEDTGTGAPSPDGAVTSMQLAHVTIDGGQANIQNAHINNTFKHSGAYDDPVTLDPTGDMVDGNAEIDTCPLSVREGNGIARLSGAVRRSGSLMFQPGVDYTVATLPSSLWPKYSRWGTAACSINTVGSDSGTLTCRVNVSTTGAIVVRTPSTQEFHWVLLDGVTYELD